MRKKRCFSALMEILIFSTVATLTNSIKKTTKLSIKNRFNDINKWCKPNEIV